MATNTTAHVFPVDLVWENHRKGLLTSPGLVPIETATPPPFNQGMEGFWSPEHLFAASVNACYMTTFLAIAENSKLEFTDFSCHAEGVLEQIDGKFLMTEVKLYPTLAITLESDRSKAERILQKSEAACLISNSIKATTSLHYVIHVKQLNLERE